MGKSLVKVCSVCKGRGETMRPEVGGQGSKYRQCVNCVGTGLYLQDVIVRLAELETQIKRLGGQPLPQVYDRLDLIEVQCNELRLILGLETK